MQDAPYLCMPLKYRAIIQYAEMNDDFQPLDNKGKKFVWEVMGTFLLWKDYGKHNTHGIKCNSSTAS